MGISNKNEASRQPTATEAPLRLLIDTVPALIHTALPDGSLDFLNQCWLEAAEPTGQTALAQKLTAQEKGAIEAALKESRGRVFGPSGAAANLGIPRSTFRVEDSVAEDRQASLQDVGEADHSRLTLNARQTATFWLKMSHRNYRPVSEVICILPNGSLELE